MEVPPAVVATLLAGSNLKSDELLQQTHHEYQYQDSQLPVDIGGQSKEPDEMQRYLWVSFVRYVTQLCQVHLLSVPHLLCLDPLQGQKLSAVSYCSAPVNPG